MNRYLSRTTCAAGLKAGGVVYDFRRGFNYSIRSIRGNMKQSKEQLTRRRDEINEQLNRVKKDLRIELDRDGEEQAIQIEQDEVAISMESNLRRELAMIEDQLLDLESE